ncbi:hypothetical protein GCM10010497_09660 [Streptomyces cinereoruber]|uniref:Uncharacterized protein n=1 Tax=Streptomyces cinereoruber TaxID=67260 RepID=A0AAV4KC60_9ACTN|nr:hypothetical protein GCM10010497_09660 [Streptomyces cinereoruber]
MGGAVLAPVLLAQAFGEDGVLGDAGGRTGAFGHDGVLGHGASGRCGLSEHVIEYTVLHYEYGVLSFKAERFKVAA